MKNIDDKKAEFLKAYDHLSEPLFRRFWYKLSDKERAQDLLQETFTKAWQYIVEGKKVRNLKSFLYAIANHMIIDEYRKSRSVSLDELTESGFDKALEGGHQSILDDVELNKIVITIEKLPQKYKEIIKMRYIDGLELVEISEIIGESENVVSVRINRGTKKLQKMLHL
ncbi:MAG: hypothetical protein A3G52_04885 [Candidatus Taylorbacteria bacterium RIFCSPLOWO2_12_FULL_43_20]|uniref:RNA polymerase sigma factor n=1 Tax=Candidatus Taylorbacteria bacterium RIFCSPLOWO2_12_FULL_43_20 TaxID=1802332 RepID=A0A1G2P218_9BACT|nr:MAG: hypothetical protein A3B98_04490 [Candidatus Taylorbacteria bacterium RIFCSPHIGHO2_02_FULL_43_55]OHA29856.1 MAG: hypothetical protein A3E92_02615 [Candidatus Taylorbacteria bacterium RIFCSPHIGHO2_12_FULL_42_34]OHA31644.1 MAG: hypothetical protein A3B09_03580 [Candidatus Taylorbacteria bacterium RIFCSPLOWO2_01_FULL_43_83]OHA38946.1 MAG: hypothetical protein A3H58_01315 [Candidatus Taylorbacteria bacterium RIFCSPLOWO2_02_FULL_43_22b]OHA42385.1 MAG: hypothetical protein A3G52_04885 [Candid